MNSIYEITPFTMTDYPGKLACIVWFSGCNMRCIYCYNTDVVTSKGSLSDEEFIKFLKSRQGKLNGVVFSGGECTNAKNFLKLLSVAKSLGYSTKVDTNATNLKALKEAIKLDLIDYIAIDFKALREDFALLTNTNLYDKFIQTLRYLLKINFDFEVRTTIHADFIDENDISKMAEILEKNGYKKSYFLQNFLSTTQNFGCIQAPSKPFDPSKIHSNLDIKLRNF